MEETIKPGTMLIAEGITLPASLQFETEPYVAGWRRVKNLDNKGFGRIITRTGWNYFYIAGAIKTGAFGSHGKKATRAAIKKIIARLKSKNFNCLEIIEVTAKRSLGLPHMSVSARSRHIQQSMTLFGD